MNERAGNSEQLKRRILFGPSGHPWAGPRNGEHMPFAGHRTQQEVREQEEAAHARLAWCPPEYRVHYLELRKKGFSAAEATPLIKEQILTDVRRSFALAVGCGCEKDSK